MATFRDRAGCAVRGLYCGCVRGIYFISADASASRRSPRRRMPCFVTRSARATVDFFKIYIHVALTWHKRAITLRL